MMKTSIKLMKLGSSIKSEGKLNSEGSILIYEQFRGKTRPRIFRSFTKYIKAKLSQAM
jgi:hypothetical protein